MLYGDGPVPVGNGPVPVEKGPVPVENVPVSEKLPLGDEDVTFDAVTGELGKDDETPVPGVNITALTVLLSVAVEMLINVTVDEDNCSVHVVVTMEVELEAVTGDVTVEPGVLVVLE